MRSNIVYIFLCTFILLFNNCAQINYSYSQEKTIHCISDAPLYYLSVVEDGTIYASGEEILVIKKDDGRFFPLKNYKIIGKTKSQAWAISSDIMYYNGNNWKKYPLPITNCQPIDIFLFGKNIYIEMSNNHIYKAEAQKLIPLRKSMAKSIKKSGLIWRPSIVFSGWSRVWAIEKKENIYLVSSILAN